MASGTVDQTPAYAENDLDRDRVRAMMESFFNRKENEAQAAQPPTRDPGPASTCALELSRICPLFLAGNLPDPAEMCLLWSLRSEQRCMELQHPDKES